MKNRRINIIEKSLQNTSMVTGLSAGAPNHLTIVQIGIHLCVGVKEPCLDELYLD